MLRALQRLLTVRPAFTLAGLRLLWLAILIQGIQELVFSVLVFSSEWGTGDIGLALSAVATAVSYAGLRLLILRILLEIASAILVKPIPAAPPRPPPLGPLYNLVVLNPVFTAWGLRLVWLAALIAWAAYYVAGLAALTTVDWAGLGSATALIRTAFRLVVQPLILVALVRVTVEVAARVLPKGAAADPRPRRINVLVIGSGGREHALAWKIAQSPNLAKLYAAPGNPGIAGCADLADVDATSAHALIDFCRAKEIGLVVVGPEGPLVAGLVDDLAAAGIRAFGPSRAAAQLEGSKGYTKQLCAEAGIPTAAWARFDDAEAARAHARARGAPMVVKADGLAAGKGVSVAMTIEDALAAIDACFAGAYGAAGAAVIIEDWLAGEEASFFVLSDGNTALPLPTAQDHKRVGDGDTGPNTGGMGAYSPALAMTPSQVGRAMDEIVAPTLAAMRARGTPFTGVLYAGLMLTADGPKLIEYNVRFGDPETQVLMMRLDTDLLELLFATATGRLAEVTPRWSDDAALTVVMAARGYPGPYERGSVIAGIDAAEALPGVKVFQAGTALRDGRLVAEGGRVLDVTARGATIAEAQARAYQAVGKIDWPGGFCRHDIGSRAISAREPLSGPPV